MDDSSMNPAEDEHLTGAPETPEDVAVLYTWANVHGGKYRDFSAERREHRAQQRHRVVEAQRQAELDAARSREEAAARELEEARLREQDAAGEVARKEAEEARHLAEERASHERQAAQRHVETAENLKRALEDAQREMEEARRRVEEQAARYAEADARYRDSTREELPGEINDPYYYAGHLEPTAFAPGKGVRSSVPQRVSSERRITENYHRSKGSAEMPAATAPERDPHGLFSSGIRPRSSGSRSPYTESYAYPERRTETPEDTRERNRPDELDRLHRSGDSHEYEIDDAGYYDHRLDRRSASSVTPAPARTASDPNSAPRDLHIPPRASASRPSSASDEGPDRRVMRSVDPEPGNTHVLDNSRVRRRESATDISARTTRRSRQEPIAQPVSEAAEYSAESLKAMRRLPTDRRWSDATLPPTHRDEPVRSPEGRPEWFGRDARVPEASSRQERHATEPQERAIPSERISAREDRSYGEESVREEQRSRPSAYSGQFVPASDGGFNLPPLPDRFPASRTETRRDSDRHELPSARVSETRGVERISDIRAMRDVQPTTLPAAQRVAEVPQARPGSSEASSQPASRPSGDTLQQSRERVAARWFALKGLVGGNTETSSEPAPARNQEIPVPTLCVMSLSGGVGKTSMVATIGRTLSSMGERVLLADATPHGLLPYYFGARELRPNVVRTFSPPPDSRDAPVFMVNYEAEGMHNDDEGQAALLEEIAQHARGTQRILLDLNSPSAWLGRRLAEKQAKILVPISPDMNSVLGIKNMERFFAGTQDAEGRPVRPYYVLNQFDASLPLHLDVREVLRQQLGDRLLPVLIRRSPAVAEALAEGMTVMDYAPESPVAEDYTHLAEWARNLAAPAQNSMRSIRWSER
ncbi:cellulose synthase operon protein YhjQ/BcsQ [Terriglobus sp. RCC_193]|uniref:cellulose synthase operon protein YhjQ/BcsQ n=1 Tax=Terriglobus sp. RCC_193 TaxID=3239218 RepID=UPI003524FA46